MKKIIISLLLVLITTSVTILPAQAETPAPEPKKESELIPKVVYPEGINKEATKLAVVDALPDSDWRVMLANVIQFMLGITGSLALVSFTAGGIMMITAQGKDEQISKGKGILMWSVMALIIIAVSYGIVLGVTQLKFFGP
jgi:hypothetical protein